MPAYSIRPLEESTWDAFAALVEANTGVWGGCWCMAFHDEGVGKHSSPAQNRAAKHDRVLSKRAHAALVFDADRAVGWVQFGRPEELPRIKHRRAYEREPTPAPDWRITCFFVDKGRRGQGVAAAGLAGALVLIGTAGGGLTEAITEDTTGRRAQASLLFLGTLELFEAHGFQRRRQLGKHAWLASRHV